MKISILARNESFGAKLNISSANRNALFYEGSIIDAVIRVHLSALD
jgi:hypothetical protein